MRLNPVWAKLLPEIGQIFPCLFLFCHQYYIDILQFTNTVNKYSPNVYFSFIFELNKWIRNCQDWSVVRLSQYISNWSEISRFVFGPFEPLFRFFRTAVGSTELPSKTDAASEPMKLFGVITVPSKPAATFQCSLRFRTCLIVLSSQP